MSRLEHTLALLGSLLFGLPTLASPRSASSFVQELGEKPLRWGTSPAWVARAGWLGLVSWSPTKITSLPTACGAMT
jgi:hypothetical protein